MMSINLTFAIFFLICITYTRGKALIEEEIIVDLADEMRRARIVPNIIPKAPTKLLSVFLPNGKLRPGLLLHHDNDHSKPGIVFEANETTYHTLFVTVVFNWDKEELIERRSPGMTTPTYAQEQWHEWMCVNIPGNEYLIGEDYFKVKRPHMDLSIEMVNLYLYLLYQQPGKLNFKKPYEQLKPDGQIVKTIQDYVEFYNLTGPIEGNFHYRGWQHALPEHKLPWYVPPP